MYKGALLCSLLPASVLAVLAAGAPANGFIRADATIETLRIRQGELVDQQRTIYAQADAENGRPLSTEEQRDIDNLQAEWERIEQDCGRRERMAAQNARMATPQPRATVAEPLPGDDDEEVDAQPVRLSQIRNGLARPPALAAARQLTRAVPGNGGYRNFGEFARSVRLAARKVDPFVDPRLSAIQAAAATQITQESVGEDGGYLVPPDFLAQITQTILAEDSLLALCDPLTTGKNAVNMPMDETTQWGSGGIKAYWAAEAAAMQQSKPALNSDTLKLHKLTALVPITEEMLEDAPLIDSYLRRKTPEAFDWSIGMGFVWGSGAGMPLGFMNSPALVTQAAEGGQTADTIVQANVSKMKSRMPARSRKTAVWLIHPDAEPQLEGMTVGNQPVYMPPGGLSEAPYGRLFGRPVIPHQVCETVGNLGDIMFVDFRQYTAVIKAGGVKLVISIHLWFDQDLQAYKFTFRVAGQPTWSKAMTPRSGSNTMSPFIVLGAR